MARIELYHNLSNGAKLHCRRLACLNWKDLQRISEPRRLDLHVIPQHQLHGIRMQIHLLVHPIGHRVAAQVVLEPVCSYVSGTISGTSPCRYLSISRGFELRDKRNAEGSGPVGLPSAKQPPAPLPA
jgi:hypothetical protein